MTRRISGARPKREVQPEELFRALENDPNISNWELLAKAVDRSRGVLRKSMERQGYREEIELIFAIREEEQFEETRDSILMYVYLLSLILERTPDSHEYQEFGMPCSFSVVYYCGSYHAAHVEVGLPPNQVGQWGHKNLRVPLSYLSTDREARRRQNPYAFRPSRYQTSQT